MRAPPMSLMVSLLLALGCGDDSTPMPSTTVPDAGAELEMDDESGEAPVPQQALGCEMGEYGLLDAQCGSCFCEACTMFMSDCDDDCWRLLGCIVTNCDHDPNDPDCASALCTAFIGAAGKLQGFASCSEGCKQPCNFGP